MQYPRIGVTLDSQEPGGYSKMPWYALRKNYCSSVVEAGGMPIPLPHDVSLVEAYLDLLDGLLITGGAFDIHPSLFGEEDVHPAVTTKPDRTVFEMAILQGAMARNMPMLGICGGQQLLNVALGGTLIQHIPDAIPNALNHEQPNPRTEPGHTIDIKRDSMLFDIVGVTHMEVNSAHHQAVKTVSNTAAINAYAPDGVIEGIESADFRFCLGVQWHPECNVSLHDKKIFDAFVGACR